MRLHRVAVLVVLLLTAMFAVAQRTTGEIRGVITDPNGAVVSGATVSAKNLATNAERTVTSSGEGVFAFTDVPVGTYQVTVTSKGFKDAVIKDVVVNVATATNISPKMTVGTTGETVEVSATAIQVQTDSGAVGEVVSGAQVRELPLNGENFMALTQLQPGVSAANFFNTRDKGLKGGSDFSVNGNPVTNNLFLVDGANNNDVGSNRTILIYPSVDAIQEFKMLRNSYGPEYGQASGSVISIVTRGGTNQFHGGVDYFGRNDALNSTEYFAAQNAAAQKAAGNPLPNGGKDKLRRNDYGFHIGGPIKKDKLFFFWSEEWNKEIRGFTRRACVPTAAERSGDFSNPSCGEPVPNCGAACPGGVITNPSPAGLLLAQLLPLPNSVPSAANGGKNWVLSTPSKTDWREDNIRADFNITPKNTATFRYTQDAWNNPAPHDFPKYWGDDPFPVVEGNWNQPSKSIIGKVTSVITNTLVNDAQFSYSGNRIITSNGGTNPGLADQIDAAIPTVFPSSGKLKGGLPTIWSGFGAYGDFNNLWGIAPYGNSMDLYTVRDDVSKTWGNHSFKVGAYLTWNGKNEDDWGGHDRPQFGAADWAVGTPTGNDLANILLPGQIVNGVAESNINPTDHGRWNDYEFYFGDTWKAKSNLTVEYGFRWSMLMEPYEAHNAMSSWDVNFFDPSKPAGDVCNGLVVVPGTDPCGAFNKANGTTFSSGTPGPNRALVENNFHNIAPRLGIAWDPWGDGKTAIRAGLGQFFQRERVSPQVGLALNTPFSISSSTNRSLDTLPPPGTPSVSSPSTGHSRRGVTPNSWQWNLTVERQLARETSLELGYVGNKGLHLTNTYDQNPVLAADRIQAAFSSDANFVNSLRRAPVFGTINEFSRDGWSTYHSLQALFRSRVTKWMNVQASYTWSHSIANIDLDNSSGSGGASNFTDVFNPGLDKGNSVINRPHIFVANAIFNLPSFKGSNAFVHQALGDWEFSTITTAESGNSVTVYTQGVASPGSTLANLSGTGFTQNQRPDITGIGCNSGISGAPREQIFNPAAFTFNGFAVGSIGNAGRGYCRGPGNVNSDLALYKNWNAGERVKIQLRLEMFNAFNHANFRGDSLNAQYTVTGSGVVCGAAACSPANNVITGLAPGSSIANTFGLASSTNGGREVQYGLKINF
jgi:hypothetical protein